MRDQTRRMQSAAAELRFESAGKIKAFVDSARPARAKGRSGTSACSQDFAFLILQHGPREGTAKVFLVTPGRIEQIFSLIGEPTQPADLLRLALALAEQRRRASVDAVGAERVGVVAHHLFSPKQAQGAARRRGRFPPARPSRGEGVHQGITRSEKAAAGSRSRRRKGRA